MPQGVFGTEFAKHVAVDHSKGEYGPRRWRNQHGRGVFAQFKRSIDGTHHHFSRDHLPRYLAEFDFRNTTRKVGDQARFVRIMGQTGGRRTAYRSTTA